LRRLTNVLATVQRGVAAADSLFDTLDQPGEVDDGDYVAERVEGHVAFKEVSLSYAEDGRAALENIDLEIRPGTTTAIVGRSGSGKTSLVSLIPRFYRPTAGTVTIDGVEVGAYRLATLRRQVAVVSQHVVLFNDTVAGNIAYGRLHEADRDSVIRAAEQAGATAFIERLPEGMDTLIGSDGVQLSGGERQRIAIARAILQDAPILILDEATSALDSETERDVYRALEALAHERTTLVIAHRLSTVENADQVVVLDQGRLVEQGTHAELIQRDGHYAALHRIQFKDDSSE
jgi:subfamily B ATP-binding cassette protein MsbA